MRSGLLEPEDRLQLVGHGNPASEARLLATRIDLLDAFDDSRVEVEMVPRIADLEADIVIVSSGVGISSQCTNRRDMGAMNLDLFHEIAERCTNHVSDAKVSIWKFFENKKRVLNIRVFLGGSYVPCLSLISVYI